MQTRKLTVQSTHGTPTIAEKIFTSEVHNHCTFWGSILLAATNTKQLSSRTAIVSTLVHYVNRHFSFSGWPARQCSWRKIRKGLKYHGSYCSCGNGEGALRRLCGVLKDPQIQVLVVWNDVIEEFISKNKFTMWLSKVRVWEMKLQWKTVMEFTLVPYFQCCCEPLKINATLSAQLVSPKLMSVHTQKSTIPSITWYIIDFDSLEC